MAGSVDIRKVAFVADYMPRKCGIAVYVRPAQCGGE
jgi:hypothetical protein